MHNAFGQMVRHVSEDEALYAVGVSGSGTVGDCCVNELWRFLKDGDEIELEASGRGASSGTELSRRMCRCSRRSRSAYRCDLRETIVLSNPGN